MWGKASFNDWLILYRDSKPYDFVENHEHYDFLHFVLYYKNIPVLIDSGRASYVDNHQHFYATSAMFHNSLTIDGVAYKANKNKLYPRDYYKNKCSVSKEMYDDSLKIIFYTDGFNRIDKNINFMRKIIITNTKFIVSDNSFSNQDHNIENFFHFDKNIKLDATSNTAILNLKNNTLIFSKFDNYLKSNNNLSLMSTKYGEIQNKPVLHSVNKISSEMKVIHSLEIA